MRYGIVFVTLALATAGCGAPPSPVIADLERDKVVIQAHQATGWISVASKAEEGCAMHDRVPTMLNERCLDQYCTYKNILFACLDKPQ